MGTLTPLVWERSARHYGHFLCVSGMTLTKLVYSISKEIILKKIRKEFIL